MKEAYTHAQISRNNELKDTLILTTGDIGRYIWQHLYTSLPILIILLFLFAWCLKWWYEGCDIRGKKWYQHAFVCGFPFIFETLITFFFFFNFRAAKGDLVPFALLHLLHCLLSKSASVSGAAYTEIRALVAAKSVKLQNFFSQYKKPICQVRVSIGLDYRTWQCFVRVKKTTTYIRFTFLASNDIFLKTMYSV